ncbi:hypothetical protein KP78_17800 [Jeotgalibacillus soli]|uniref:Uncharacterized protein n=1 Tax=Jeotgalibacillus soli TaxID=889306 RepID=A0A0C2VE44_9BACL|nr:hypothetical protein KP78_17800 [Jeotgalibacillus soli]
MFEFSKSKGFEKGKRGKNFLKRKIKTSPMTRLSTNSR